MSQLNYLNVGNSVKENNMCECLNLKKTVKSQVSSVYFNLSWVSGGRGVFGMILFITCSAVILDADWSIGLRPGAVHPL